MATTAAGEMYVLKPIHKDFNVETSTCMYQMKNLHGNMVSASPMRSEVVVDPDMQSLIEKDRKITSDLVLLTEELQELSQILGHKFGEVGPQLAGNIQVETHVATHVATPSAPPLELPDGISDFVITMSPRQPALSAVLLAELLGSRGNHVATPTQKHSSLTEDIPSNLLAATGGLSGRVQHNIDQLVFTFIWKDDLFCPALMHVPRLQTRIMGDVNIARYLSRILYPQLYDESNINNVVQIDTWIDTAGKITSGSSQEKDSALKSMNSHLGTNNFFCGGNLSLADITLLAALLTNSNILKALPNNLQSWFSRMRGSFGNTISRIETSSSPTIELPDGISDFVFSVSPKQPALSAVLIADLLESRGNHVATPTQKHSSLTEDIPSNLLAATGGLSGRVQHNIDQLVFTFIWKDDLLCPSLMHVPQVQTRIMGDANIARYLSRILYPQLYDESNINNVVQIDTWIDTAGKITNGNLQEKELALKSMNSHLEKNNFFCGGNLTLADVTLLAALLTSSDTLKALPINVQSWFSRIRGSFANTISRVGVPETWCDE